MVWTDTHAVSRQFLSLSLPHPSHPLSIYLSIHPSLSLTPSPSPSPSLPIPIPHPPSNSPAPCQERERTEMMRGSVREGIMGAALLTGPAMAAAYACRPGGRAAGRGGTPRQREVEKGKGGAAAPSTPRWPVPRARADSDASLVDAGANAGTGLEPAAAGRLLSWRRRALSPSRLLSRRLGHGRTPSPRLEPASAAGRPAMSPTWWSREAPRASVRVRVRAAGPSRRLSSGPVVPASGAGSAVVLSKLGLETAMGPMVLCALSIACPQGWPRRRGARGARRPKPPRRAEA